MSIRKNTLDLDSHYDLTKSGQNDYVGSPILFSWGSGGSGRLGQNTTTNVSSPVQIPGLLMEFHIYWCYSFISNQD
jgi:hypothetical protein